MNAYIWLAVAAVAAVIEAVSFGLITMWFVIGALVAFAVGFFGGPLWLQLVLFFVVSLVTLILFRPIIMKYRARGEAHEPTLVGTRAIVVETIDNAALKGRVETPDHMTWAALSSDQSILEEGAQVQVVDQKSVKLIVERI